ncbi:MAG: tetratricopeptide repeat-containing sulfotransferase family protein [Rhodanobacter sp.]
MNIMIAGEALEVGRVDEAERRLADASASDPQHPEVLRMQAGIHSLRGRSQQAISTMRQALAQRPQDALYHNTLGTLLGSAGEFDAAIAALRHCCELQPDLALAWYNLGVMLTRSVRNDEAASALQRAVALAPDHMAARALLGDMLRTRGDTGEAVAEYRKVLAELPWAGIAWWGLADLRTERFTDDDIERMQAALQQPRASEDDRIATGFALAKALDDDGRHADSLVALTQANAIARRRQQWNADAFSTGITAIQQAFAPPPAAAAEPLGKEVIFIVSLPRSGSTLIEQILASHSSVEGAGELPDLPQVLGEESRRRGQPFPQWVRAMQPADWERLGRRYLERTAHWRPQRPVFTDKLPNNWMYIGAIRAMLPGARIIACRRDPLETCFSCYRQYLAGNEYTRTFDDLAAFWRDFDRSIRHWHALHPAQVFEHEYERLLADPEAHIRRLLDFCRLPFEPACVNFHENRREVRSPSATQVRQPLHDTARAPRYGALLDPLRTALQLPPWQPHGTP